jgi:hypothetical protein
MLLKNKSTRQLIREQMMEVMSAAQHLGVKNLDVAFVYDGQHDALFAIHATGLRLPPSYGDILSLHPSLRDCPRGWLSYAKTGDAGGRAAIPGRNTLETHLNDIG